MKVRTWFIILMCNNIIKESDIAKNYFKEEMLFPKVYRYLKNDLCVVINDTEDASTALIVDPLTEEILSSVTFDFVPKFVVGDQLVGISDASDQVLFMDILSGKINRKIEISFTENVDFITYYGTSVYVVNKKGVYIITEGDSEFKCLIDKKNLFEFKKDIIDNSYIKSGPKHYSICVKDENHIYVGISYPDRDGYSYENYYVLFSLND